MNDVLHDLEEAPSYATKRPTVQGLEDILFKPTPILDHGFLRIMDYMGDDTSVVQAARVSYGRGTRKLSEDEGLIRYLMRHWHTTPFEMCEIKYHVKLPIFVARQWIRHRTASVNEYSARYSVLDKEFYIPSPDVLAAQSTSNKQGRAGALGEDEAKAVLDLLREDAGRNYDHYTWMLNEEVSADFDPGRSGLSRELARMNLTLNSYTQWYWKVNLHNFMHFLRLRADPHAQYEIRVYAKAMLEHLEIWAPMTYRAFMEYRIGSVTFSATMLSVLQKMLSGESVDQPSSGLTVREWTEMQASLKKELA